MYCYLLILNKSILYYLLATILDLPFTSIFFFLLSQLAKKSNTYIKN